MARSDADSKQSGAYVSLQEMFTRGTSLSDLRPARRARLRLELVRRIARLHEARVEAERQERASRSIA